MDTEIENCQNGGKFKKGRRPLKSPLKINEFYCLTCKAKRRVRSTKNISIMEINHRPVAKADCRAKKCTRKLVKYINKDQAEQLKKK